MSLEINDLNFQELIKEGTCLVDFWAPWCGPCKMLTPIIDEISKELEGKIKVFKCNVEDNQLTPASFDVMGVPALFLFKDGELVAQRTGMAPKKTILDWIVDNS